MLNPEGYPQKTSPYREIAFMKFPYIIVYEFIKEENIVYILHVFHSKRSPVTIQPPKKPFCHRFHQLSQIDIALR
jgi:hypothetical protein